MTVHRMGAWVALAVGVGLAARTRRPAVLVGVVGVILAAAPVLPMPPGFHSIRTVGRHQTRGPHPEDAALFLRGLALTLELEPVDHDLRG